MNSSSRIAATLYCLGTVCLRNISINTLHNGDGDDDDDDDDDDNNNNTNTAAAAAAAAATTTSTMLLIPLHFFSL